MFFFKQKTAYELGLGIPAEPLFRSFQTALASIKLIKASAVLDLTEDDFDFLTSNRSEERRVGKECRCLWWRCDERKNDAHGGWLRSVQQGERVDELCRERDAWVSAR